MEVIWLFKIPKSERGIDLTKNLNIPPVSVDRLTEVMLRQDARGIAISRRKKNEKEEVTRRRTAAFLGILRKDKKKVEKTREIARMSLRLQATPHSFP